MSVDPFDQTALQRRSLKGQLPILLPSLDQSFSQLRPFQGNSPTDPSFSKHSTDYSININNSSHNNNNSGNSGNTRSSYSQHGLVGALQNPFGPAKPHVSRTSLASYKTCHDPQLPPIMSSSYSPSSSTSSVLSSSASGKPSTIHLQQSQNGVTNQQSATASRRSRSKSLSTIELPPLRSLGMLQNHNNYTLPPIRSECLLYANGPASVYSDPYVSNNVNGGHYGQPSPSSSSSALGYTLLSVNGESVSSGSTNAAINRNRHASISSMTSSAIFGSKSPSPIPPNAYYNNSGNTNFHRNGSISSVDYYQNNSNNYATNNILTKSKTSPEAVTGMFYEPGAKANNTFGMDPSFQGSYRLNGEQINDEFPQNFASAASGVSSANVNAASALLSLKQKKRRQRSGPSCDLCRVRKVKCDAEIIILKELSNTIPESVAKDDSDNIPIKVIDNFNPADFNISEKKLKQIYSDHYLNYYFDFGNTAGTGGEASSPMAVDRNGDESSFCQFIQTPTKLIRFKSCSACKSRNADCFFSKGYTRAEILKFNKSKRISNGGTKK